MSTVFIETLEPVMAVSKMLGLLNFCCTATKETGIILCPHTNWSLFLETIRTFVFLVSSYHVIFNMSSKHIILVFNTLQYWTIIIAARRSQKTLIQFVNGIVEFDRELLSFRSAMHGIAAAVGSRAPNKTFWTAAFAGLFGYSWGVQAKMTTANFTLDWLRRTRGADLLFHSPVVIVPAVFATACFYLYNLGHRFRELNGLCERLPPGLTDPTGRWTDSEMTVFAERARLLHARLCALLRLFSAALGPALLAFFATTFAMSFVDVFFMVVFKDVRVKLGLMPFVFYAQYVAFTLTILGVATWAIEKVQQRAPSSFSG